MSKTLATFRIEEDDWLDFKAWADSKGSNASSELIKFVLTSIGKQKNAPSSEHIDKRIDERLAACLDDLSLNSIDNKIAEAIANLTSDENFIEAIASKLPA